MKRKRVFACALFVTMLLTSCSNNQEVKEPENDDMIILDELSDTRQQELDRVMELDYDNLHIANSFDFTVPDELGRYQVVCMDHFQDQWDTLVSNYIPEDIYDESKVTLDEKYVPVGPEFRDDENAMYVSVGNTGFFTYTINEDQLLYSAMHEGDSFSQHESYYLNGDYSDDEYSLNGENVSVSEAVAESNRFASDFTKLTNYPGEIVPSVAVAYQNNEGDAVINVKMTNMYKKLPIFNIPSNFMDLSFDIFCEGGAVTYCKEKNKISSFTVQYGVDDYKTLETYDQVMTPEAALKRFQKSLALNVEYNVIGMELVYCPTSVEDTQKSNADDNPPEVNDSFGAGSIVELTPYWAIYIDVTPLREMYGLVNCQTGDVEFANNQR